MVIYSFHFYWNKLEGVSKIITIQNTKNTMILYTTTLKDYVNTDYILDVDSATTPNFDGNNWESFIAYLSVLSKYHILPANKNKKMGSNEEKIMLFCLELTRL